MESHSQLPYNYEIKENSYHFITISGVEYIAYFLEMNMFNACKVYSFSFERPQQGNSTYDLRVGITILKIIGDFFEKNENTLLFTCDDGDGKQHYRNRLFDNWYKKYGVNEFDKHDKNIYETFTSIIIRKDNPFYKETINEFEEFVSYFIN